jgi:hypothetical protein
MLSRYYIEAIDLITEKNERVFVANLFCTARTAATNHHTWLESKKLLEAGIVVLVSSADNPIKKEDITGLSIAKSATFEWTAKEYRSVLMELLIHLAEISCLLGEFDYARLIAECIYAKINFEMDGPDIYRLAMHLFSDLGMMVEMFDMSLKHFDESDEVLANSDHEWVAALDVEFSKFKHQMALLDLEDCEMDHTKVPEKVNQRQLLLYYAAASTHQQSLGPKFDYFILKVSILTT